MLPDKFKKDLLDGYILTSDSPLDKNIVKDYFIKPNNFSKEPIALKLRPGFFIEKQGSPWEPIKYGPLTFSLRIDPNEHERKYDLD